MAALLSNMIAAVLAVAAALAVAGVSAQTHHVVGGWGPTLDVNSWLSGRVFRVGDKILFKSSGTEDSVSVVELPGPEELASCNFTNPIRMYTDRESHVALDKEGVRYFASGNLNSCKNGLKLPVPVHSYPPSEYDIPSPPRAFHPPPEMDPPPHPHPHPSAAARLSDASVVILAGMLVAMAHLMAS